MERAVESRRWQVAGRVARIAGLVILMLSGPGAPAVGLGQEIEWVPVSSSGPFSLGPNQITIPGGAAVRVNFEVYINGWGQAPGAPRLGAFNASLLPSSLLGANALPGNPGVDIGIPTPIACTTAANCPSGFCGVFEENFCDDTVPSFAVKFVCLSDMTKACNSAQASAICGSPVCISNAAYVLSGCPSTPPFIPPPWYEWSDACQSGGVTDGGSNYYAGSLRLDVPANAKGTYTLRWDAGPEKSFLNDENAIRIPGLTLTDGVLTIETDRCCYGVGTTGAGCDDNVTAAQCNARPGPRFFEPKTLCPQSGGPICAECLTDDPRPCKDPLPSQAGDDNLCTSNDCVALEPGGLGGECVNTPRYNPAGQCCNPALGPPGGVTGIDDLDVCTVDVCDADTGVVTHDPAGATGRSCSDGLPCTIDDACDGINSTAEGGCVGDDVNAIPCDGDEDCPAGYCDTGLGLCSCVAPLMATAPHDIRKNRYVSIDPSTTGEPAIFRVELANNTCSVTDMRCVVANDCRTCSGNRSVACKLFSDCPVGTGPCDTGLGETCDPDPAPIFLGYVSEPADNGFGDQVSIVQPMPPAFRTWTENPLHIGDCETRPDRTYAVSAATETSPTMFSLPLYVGTTDKPQGKDWGDLVGGKSGLNWTAPNYLVNVDDVVAFIHFVTNKPIPPHRTVLDLEGPPTRWLNDVVNATDLQMIFSGFSGGVFPPPNFVMTGYPADGNVANCP